MFTEREVLCLKTLSNVSRLFISSVDWSVYNALQSDLEMQDLRDYYNSYLAAGHIEVYNPVSIMSTFEHSEIKNYWVRTGLITTITFVLQ